MSDDTHVVKDGEENSEIGSSVEDELSLFGKIVTVIVIALICFGIFWGTPARLAFNWLTQRPVQCTVESASAPPANGNNTSLSLYVDTTDCGTIILPRNSDAQAQKEAEAFNMFKGQKVTFQLGYFARGLLGTQANGYTLPGQ